MSETIHELRTEHLEEAVRFIREQIFELRGVRGDLAEMLPRYRWLYVDSPRRRDDFIGWGLRDDAGELVGTHLIAWQHYTRGGEEVRALVSTNSYVAELHRGPAGLGLMLNMRRRADADLCMCTTANVNSGSVWKSMKGFEMEGAGWEFLIPVNWSAWAVAGAVRKTPWPWLKSAVDAAGAMLPGVRRRFSAAAGWSVDEVRDEDLPRVSTAPLSDKWEPLRDEAFLRWRYPDYPGQGVRLLRLNRSAPGGELFVGVKSGLRGYGRGLRQMVIMDVHGAREQDGEGIVAALAAHFRGRVDLVGVRLLAAMLWEESLAPLASRRKLEFPTHWMQSRKMTLEASEWRPSQGDGDGCM